MAVPERRAAGLRPADVSAQEFTLARKGYDPEEVHAFLVRVAEHLGRLQGEIEWQRARTEHLERRTAAAQESAYARLSRDFMEVVRRADEAAARVRAQSEARAAGEVAAARQEAERIVAQARLDARGVLLEAEREAAVLRARAQSDLQAARDDANRLGGAGLPAIEVLPSEVPEVAEDPWPGEDLLIDTAAYDAWELDAIWSTPMEPPPVRPALEGPADPFDDLEVSIDPSLFDLFDDPGLT
jgi:DivIVA domain-containing protein